MQQFGRYIRQMALPEFGKESQKRLLSSSVAIAGVGGLGSPLCLYLAAAGVGHLHLFEHDRVDLSNLNRQILYTEQDLGEQKITVAEAAIQRFNPHVSVYAYNVKAEESGFDFAKVDVILDATDNFATRYFLNSVSLRHNKPLVHASVYGMEGRVASFVPGETACYRCLYPKPYIYESKPVIGVTPGIGGMLQAAEAINYLVTGRLALAGKLLVYDLYDMTFDTVNIPREEACPDCARG